jgi:HK97 family phage prohead protease
MTIGENVALYVQHDSTGLPLARTGANTLHFMEDEQGLRFHAILPESRKDVAEAISRGDIGGVSVGFIVEIDKWDHRQDELPSTRTVVKATLIELSLVAAGAYPDALLD